jgi:tRNA-modifying protein YgfZ
MAKGQIVELKRRGVVAVGGADAEKFLNDLVTSDIAGASRERAVYAALLTPQGKILFDFIIFRDDGHFLFDLPRSLVEDFVKRLGFYRLRAKVEIADLSDERIVVAAWGSDSPPIVDGPVAPDPRLASLGFRAITPPGADMAPDFDEASEADYDAHRIKLGVPEGGIDFPFGQAFPHDADLDQLAGVDFRKGCFIGQEVVSRMEHRGTARRRIVIVHADGALPAAGTPVTAGERPLGSLGSSVGRLGLALIRLDRTKEAVDNGIGVTTGDVAIALTLPGWAKFGWPTGLAED